MLIEKPLSQAEIDELDDFLTSDAVPEDCMDLSELHGFLTAVAIGPGIILPSEWLPEVWGDEGGPKFESLDDARRISELILRLYNSILLTLEHDPKEFLPMIPVEETPEGEPDPQPEGWCVGFMLGVGLKKEDWTALVVDDDKHATLLAPMLAFGVEGALDKVLASNANPGLARNKLAATIPIAVAGIYAYWLLRRHQRSPGLTPDRFYVGGGKIARNEPCPCGSGKKYKKCCGSAVAGSA